jgi:hypothetical protein
LSERKTSTTKKREKIMNLLIVKVHNNNTLEIQNNTRVPALSTIKLNNNEFTLTEAPRIISEEETAKEFITILNNMYQTKNPVLFNRENRKTISNVFPGYYPAKTIRIVDNRLAGKTIEQGCR